jgi:hypothetical protein
VSDVLPVAEDPEARVISGTVWAGGERPGVLAGVRVRLPRFGVEIVTDEHGAYRLECPPSSHARVDLLAICGGYHSHKAKVAPGNEHTFTMKKIQ